MSEMDITFYRVRDEMVRRGFEVAAKELHERWSLSRALLLARAWGVHS
jgi:hypothetical protein